MSRENIGDVASSEEEQFIIHGDLDESGTGIGRCEYSSNGDFYEGEWRDCQFHGKGVLTCSDGSYYKGWFKDGWFHGKGFSSCAGKESYDGWFAYGKKPW